MSHFENAYVGRRGVAIGPGLPGWEHISQLTGQPAWYRPGRVDGRMAAWFDGIGATIGFPVGPEGPGLRTISVWLYPARERQAASVFLDGKALSTIRLKSGWNRYDFKLPPAGLGEGEHRLRFWFRHITHRRRMKTPAALGLVELRAANDAPNPASWFHVDEKGQSQPLAGPPSRWSIDIMVPEDGVLKARGLVRSGGPVDFMIRIEQDLVGRLEAARVTATQGHPVELEVPLQKWAGQIVRLSFGTDGMPGELERAQWRDVRLEERRRLASSLPAVRNVVVWTVEGMWSDDPSLGRRDQGAPTPNLDLIHREGATALRAWSGGSGARESHTRILGKHAGVSFVESLAQQGLVTGLFSANPRFDKRLQSGFQTRFLPAVRTRRFDPEPVLNAFSDWIYAHGRKRFFAYVDATALQVGKKRADSEQIWAGSSQEPAHELTARNDYWLGRIMGLLARYDALKDTAIVIAGLPSRTLRVTGKNPHHPARLYTPVLVWHPALRVTTRNSGRLYSSQGPDLRDLRSTVRQILGVQADSTSQDRSLLSVLFADQTLPSIPMSARTPYGWVVSYGQWVYWPRAKSEDRLWRYRDAVPEIVDLTTQPIISRALRDRIATIPTK